MDVNWRAPPPRNFSIQAVVNLRVLTPETFDFTRVIDRRDSSFGRDAGFTLGIVGDTDSDHSVTYDYSVTTGRLETVANSTDVFTYGYLDSSGLLETVTKAASGGNPAFVATRAYDPTRDTLDSIENKAGAITRSKYDYGVVNGGVNSIGQRMGVRTTFNLGGGHTSNPGDTSWGYDNLGQLTSAAAPGVDADRAYQYDDIGNRLFSEISNAQISDPPEVTTTAYTPDALNQYDAITPYIDDGGNVIAGTPVVPVFDDDGNMTHGPLPVSPGANSTLVWDGENRLIEVKNASNVTLVKYTYDALSRRTSRSVGVSPASITLYLYDGWNCIAEWSADLQSASLTIARTWGLDLSGTLQGAGGVGGLLAEKQGANTYYPTYDGNGNISEYLEADGDVAAHYEYDPFGNIVTESYASGFDSASFTYQFSTKPLDSETGLYYYGYRYYDPVTGRWPSRDPIEEKGFIVKRSLGLNNLKRPNTYYNFSIFKILQFSELSTQDIPLLREAAEKIRSDKQSSILKKLFERPYQFINNQPVSDLDILGLASFEFGDWLGLMPLGGWERERNVPESGGGDFRHCFESCRLGRRYPGAAVAIIEAWNKIYEDPEEPGSKEDIEANWCGYRQSFKIHKSCEEACKCSCLKRKPGDI